jgi:hypothetical protein
MVNQANTDLAQRREALQLHEASLHERMDRILNQRWISLEQEFEWKCAKNLEACHADFHAKTDATLARYKQGHKTLER